jgi:hypothetical protein
MCCSRLVAPVCAWLNQVMDIRGALGVGMSCWLLGCAVDEAGDRGSDTLCPSCIPLSGGETSDFGGGQENCEVEELPLSPAVRSDLGVDEIMDSLAEPFSATLRFELDGDERPDTVLSATVTFGAPEYWQIGVEVTDACRDSVRIPVAVNVATSDGAFVADAEGALQVRRGDLSWRLDATADLTQTSGNLPLALDESRPHLGQLRLSIDGSPAGPRGNVSVLLYYPGEDGPTDRIPLETEAPGSEHAYLGVGRFPADRCGGYGAPLDSDEAHDWLGGATPREVYDAARAGVPPVSSARWLDGNTTDLSVTLDELPASSEVCLGAAFGNARLTMDSSTALQTQDGRVDAEIMGCQLALAGTSGTVGTLHLSRTLRSMTPSQLESEAGIEGIEAGDSELVRVAFEVAYEWQDGVATGGGIIDVQDEGSNGRVDCVAWPEGSDYQEQRCVTVP